MSLFWTCLGVNPDTGAPCRAVNLAPRADCEVCGATRGHAPSESRAEGGADEQAAATRKCGYCRKRRPVERPREPETYACGGCGAISAAFCQRCGTRSPGGIVQTDQGRWCWACHDAVNVAPNVAGLGDACTVGSCRKVVVDHIEEAKLLSAKVGTEATIAKLSRRPSYFERCGIHQVRS